MDRPLTQSELVSMIYLAKQTINSSLQNLIAQGYVELKYVNSKKNKFIFLTQKGLELAQNVADSEIQAEIDALFSFSDEKRSEFIKLSKEYGEQLKKEFDKRMK